MPLQATSGAATYDAFGGGVPYVPTYIEEVFQTWLYTGNGSTQTITNGIDLAGKGGLVWVKNRSTESSQSWTDTVRGATKLLRSNFTAAEANDPNGLTAFSSSGFTVGSDSGWNANGNNLVSWTFREQPKFFDVVTFTANSSGNATFSHTLGSTPGCVILKRTDGVSSWYVWHRSLTSTNYSINLNQTGAQSDNGFAWITPESSTVSINGGFLGPNTQWVAYLFAHNAGGFGLTGTDNVISCGSFTTDGSGNATVNLGYEPQYIMFKRTDSTGNWEIYDTMRQWSLTDVESLRANLSSAAQLVGATNRSPTSTGFQFTGINASATFIYIAIRRGPMKVPTTGTSVFSAKTYSATTTSASVTHDVTFDAEINANRDAANAKFLIVDSLRGINGVSLWTASTSIEGNFPTYWSRQNQRTMYAPSAFDGWWASSSGTNSHVSYGLVRAPGFFDEVCYTGTGSNPNTLNHNLGVIPEFVIYRRRNSTGDWETGVRRNDGVYSQQSLNSTGAAYGTLANAAAAGLTATTINPPAFGSGVNVSGGTYVAYLFASCPGVSKVFNFTGNGSSQTINCGFTGGARFVMIKRTDSTGDWYVWDTARGIVANNDPHLSLNTTAAEVTSNDTIDTDSTGFVVNQVSATNVNVNGASYIGLAIA